MHEAVEIAIVVLVYTLIVGVIAVAAYALGHVV